MEPAFNTGKSIHRPPWRMDGEERDGRREREAQGERERRKERERGGWSEGEIEK